MLIQNFCFIEIVYVFVVIFIDNRCVRGDVQTTTKLPETTSVPTKKIITESTLIKRLHNVIKGVSQRLSISILNEGRMGTVAPQSAKLAESIFLTNAICDKNQTEICKIPLEVWNPDRCKCEQIEKVNNQEVTVGSRRGSFASSLLPPKLPPLLPPKLPSLPTNNNVTSASKETKTDQISYRFPFMPRLG